MKAMEAILLLLQTPVLRLQLAQACPAATAVQRFQLPQHLMLALPVRHRQAERHACRQLRT